MKEFMMIFIGGDYSELSPENIQERMGKWNAWMEDLRKQELFLDGRALQGKSTRVQGEDQVVTDGPFVETKELVSGYIVVKARDLEHATSLSNAYPDYDLEGAVEIREIQTY